MFQLNQFKLLLLKSSGPSFAGGFSHSCRQGIAYGITPDLWSYRHSHEVGLLYTSCSWCAVCAGTVVFLVWTWHCGRDHATGQFSGGHVHTHGRSNDSSLGFAGSCLCADHGDFGSARSSLWMRDGCQQNYFCLKTSSLSQLWPLWCHNTSMGEVYTKRWRVIPVSLREPPASEHLSSSVQQLTWEKSSFWNTRYSWHVREVIRRKSNKRKIPSAAAQSKAFSRERAGAWWSRRQGLTFIPPTLLHCLISFPLFWSPRP